jgi:predicted protein tyrosine phosphatase
MRKYLIYKKLVGLVNWTEDNQVLQGALQNIKEDVSFEGNTIEELKEDFINVIDDNFPSNKDDVKLKVLFVCSANKQRSKTAEEYFSKEHPEIEFKSAGTNIKLCRKHGATELTEELMEWADYVFVMEENHKELIEKHGKGIYSTKTFILNIPDLYLYYSKGLIEVLERRITFY